MNFTDFIKNFWGLSLFLIGLVYHAIWTYFQVSDHNKRLDKIESKNDDFSKDMADLKNEITSISSKLDILLSGFKK